MEQKNQTKALYIFLAVIALTGLGNGLSDSVFSNYFKDAYNADALARGIIEFPREMPGVLCMFVVSALSFMGDIRLSILGQALCITGLVALGLLTPPFGIMLIFLFINSLGMHLFVPLADGISMSLAKEGKFGAVMGKFNGVRTAFSMLAGVLVFIGFKVGFFSFTTPIKLIFLIAAGIFTVVLILLIRMRGVLGEQSKPPKAKIVFRKEYRTYYLIAVLFGARKQIMFVYGPWVLIELLGFGADTMALLAITGSAIGIFLMPAVGRWIDRFGTPRIMFVEAAAFLVIYIAYGALSAGLAGGWIAGGVIAVALAFAINMLDRMTMQFGMVRSVYMRSIALSPADVTPTLSAGLTLDHILSVLGAFLCGFLWKQWGPQYVFIFAALIAVANIIVALRIGKKLPIDPDGVHAHSPSA